MSKPVKALITASYKNRFKDLDGAVVLSIRGISSNDTNGFRNKLASKKVKLTVVKNALAASAFKGSGLEELGKLLAGSCTIAYGGESVVEVAREVMAVFKDNKNVEVKAAIMDGTIFTGAQVEELSKYPTRPEAQAQAITLVLSPARNLAGAIVGPGQKLAGIVKAIEDKKSKEEPAAA